MKARSLQKRNAVYDYVSTGRFTEKLKKNSKLLQAIIAILLKVRHT